MCNRTCSVCPQKTEGCGNLNKSYPVHPHASSSRKAVIPHPHQSSVGADLRAYARDLLVGDDNELSLVKNHREDALYV